MGRSSEYTESAGYNGPPMAMAMSSEEKLSRYPELKGFVSPPIVASLGEEDMIVFEGADSNELACRQYELGEEASDAEMRMTKRTIRRIRLGKLAEIIEVLAGDKSDNVTDNRIIQKALSEQSRLKNISTARSIEGRWNSIVGDYNLPTC